MPTKLLYLEDFDVVACEAKVVSFKKTEDERISVVLDETCFYPRGGGQDWDTGTISSVKSSFIVEEVRLDEEGVVHHIGTFTKGEFAADEDVKCEVDESVRTINTRLHSAGHLVDMAMQDLQPEWTPVRGAHYPHMSFVEYQAGDAEVAEGLTEQVQKKINELSQSTYENKLMFVPKDEMTKYCRHIPGNLPSNKPTRIVLYAEDFGIPCGGTHVRSVKDIGQITTTKIKIKKGLAKVSYAVAGIN